MKFSKEKRIFLDYASTTPVLREVKESMERYWSDLFHNPSAIYREGEEARDVLEDFRGEVARILSVQKGDIVFTSSGTESINLAILGAFEVAKSKFTKPHLIISSIEHPAVMESAREVKRRGGEVSMIDVDEDGLVSPAGVLKHVKESTFLVSIMLGNNEIGTIEPVSKIGRLIREVRHRRNSIYPLVHTDASQAASYLKVNLESLHVDMLTLDGSKIYGPKGIGVLAQRGQAELHPIIFGGGQERGLRSGTENLALISGFVTALKIAERDREKEYERVSALRAEFIKIISNKSKNLIINGPKKDILPHILSISIPGLAGSGVLGEFIILKLDSEGVMASRGSSCLSISGSDGSSVIRAIGKKELAESSIRFSFGRFTTLGEVREAARIFLKTIDGAKINA